MTRLELSAALAVFVTGATIALACLVEADTGYPARCAWERAWNGENTWVKTHYCGHWPHQVRKQ